MTKEAISVPQAVGLAFVSAIVGGAVVAAATKSASSSQSSSSSAVVRGKSGKPWRMSKWVVHNNTLKCQGLVGQGTTVAEQTADALKRLDGILAEAGLTKKNLLSVSIFISDYDHKFDEMNQIYDAWVDQENAPVRICVQAYMGPKFFVEIQAEAAV